jgi:predicted NUDIX family phosphoesterase
LQQGCEASFDRYYDDLLSIAEGDPQPENKRAFSEFLVWSSDEGLLSRRQAKDYYNRYFNVKFISLAGDYNNCSHTCPRRDRILLNMERELSDKERGLMKVSLDNQGYYRADELYQEVELVLEATCTACAAGQ